KGKNTGGMGAYAPAPAVKPEILSQVKLNIIKPVLRGMEKEGTPYQGTLYCGLMLTDDGPKVMEFNCRFGDPETQVVLPLIDDDLADILYQAATGKLRRSRIKMHDACAVCVIMASSGYPDSYKTGKLISGLDTIDEMEDGVAVFHAGTTLKGGKFYTSGGRVLGVTAVGRKNELRETIVTAYNAVQRIIFDGAYYRTDIGAKAFDS
ncbi:MAG: phosphoribosylamine--glycine ligase, partial [Chlorobi bacterium]|nr:phosphoribosylamine--glycine ligase [Chlorobiota bacterium]